MESLLAPRPFLGAVFGVEPDSGGTARLDCNLLCAGRCAMVCVHMRMYIVSWNVLEQSNHIENTTATRIAQGTSISMSSHVFVLEDQQLVPSCKEKLSTTGGQPHHQPPKTASSNSSPHSAASRSCQLETDRTESSRSCSSPGVRTDGHRTGPHGGAMPWRIAVIALGLELGGAHVTRAGRGRTSPCRVGSEGRTSRSQRKLSWPKFTSLTAMDEGQPS